jgi:ABC-type branched-subunit amino acid transport system ATPase component
MTRPRPKPGGLVPHGQERIAAHSTDALTTSHVTVRYGGLKAADDVTLVAPIGQITGLIGPNGAGKTTTFNACSGLVRPERGRVVFRGRDVTRRSPAARARLGLGRTFQIMELFDSLTVAENVGLGLEASLAGQLPHRHIRATRHEDTLVRDTAARAMALCGIEHLAQSRPRNLSTGQRRLVELARCIAGGFSVLLLDEPSSGLDEEETAQFGAVLKSLVSDGKTGILIVEHDMGLVMKITDYIYVLDFGRLIFEGTPEEAAASPLVRAAYLGAESSLLEA